MDSVTDKINCDELLMLFSKSVDLTMRRININESMFCYILCVDGLCSADLVNNTILKPIAENEYIKGEKSDKAVFDYLTNGGIYSVYLTTTTSEKAVLQSVLSGQTALVFSSLSKAIIFDVRFFARRSLSDPESESVMTGSKDCFIEALRTNTASVRRRIRSPHLVVEQGVVGRQSRTDYAILYMENICDKKVVEKIRERIEAIDIDNLGTPEFLEKYICDEQKSIFPQVILTERPDRTCSNLTDGRVVVMLDSLPYAYILPAQLVSIMQSPDDYSQNTITASVTRILRWLSLIVSLILPAFYITATTFHSFLLPKEQAVAIANAREGVPFSTFAEVILLLIAFEILMESGLRISDKIGQAMSTVGALVVGQAVVEANLVSSTALVIVAITAVLGFMIPNTALRNALRLVRFSIAVLSSLMGLIAITFGVFILLLYLCSVESFGIAYLSPIVDSDKKSQHDTFIRGSIFNFKNRDEKLSKNLTKQKVKNE